MLFLHFDTIITITRLQQISYKRSTVEPAWQKLLVHFIWLIKRHIFFLTITICKIWIIGLWIIRYSIYTQLMHVRITNAKKNGTHVFRLQSDHHLRRWLTNSRFYLTTKPKYVYGFLIFCIIYLYYIQSASGRYYNIIYILSDTYNMVRNTTYRQVDMNQHDINRAWK